MKKKKLLLKEIWHYYAQFLNKTIQNKNAFNALMQYVSCFFVASADDYLEEIFKRKSQKCAPY